MTNLIGNQSTLADVHATIQGPAVYHVQGPAVYHLTSLGARNAFSKFRGLWCTT
jgi:hypothetical protein